MEKLMHIFNVNPECKSEFKKYLADYGYRNLLCQQPVVCSHCKLPISFQLSRDQGLTRTCAFKEFRFEPPYVAGKRKERRKKTLPPIPEHMLPRRHNSFDNDDEGEDCEEGVSDMPTLPSISISPAFLTDRTDERSQSVEATMKTPQGHPFNSREFTFPESNSKRKKNSYSQPSIVNALTPRSKDLPLQAKIEKLAKQKRKERAKRVVERRYEKKSHNMQEVTSPTHHMAFKSHREPETPNNFYLRDHKQSPFKQMARYMEEAEKPRIHPRLYTKIVDGIYTYTKGRHDSGADSDNHGSYERLLVTPVTIRDTEKDADMSRQVTRLPPII